MNVRIHFKMPGSNQDRAMVFAGHVYHMKGDGNPTIAEYKLLNMDATITEFAVDVLDDDGNVVKRVTGEDL